MSDQIEITTDESTWLLKNDVFTTENVTPNNEEGIETKFEVGDIVVFEEDRARRFHKELVTSTWQGNIIAQVDAVANPSLVFNTIFPTSTGHRCSTKTNRKECFRHATDIEKSMFNKVPRRMKRRQRAFFLDDVLYNNLISDNKPLENIIDNKEEIRKCIFSEGDIVVFEEKRVTEPTHITEYWNGSIIGKVDNIFNRNLVFADYLPNEKKSKNVPRCVSNNEKYFRPATKEESEAFKKFYEKNKRLAYLTEIEPYKDNDISKEEIENAKSVLINFAQTKTPESETSSVLDHYRLYQKATINKTKVSVGNYIYIDTNSVENDYVYVSTELNNVFLSSKLAEEKGISYRGIMPQETYKILHLVEFEDECLHAICASKKDNYNDIVAVDLEKGIKHKTIKVCKESDCYYKPNKVEKTITDNITYEINKKEDENEIEEQIQKDFHKYSQKYIDDVLDEIILK